MTLNCVECNAELKAEDVFCSKCGKKIEKPSSEIKELCERYYVAGYCYGIISIKYPKLYKELCEVFEKEIPNMSYMLKNCYEMRNKLLKIKRKKKTRKRK